jgi:hypothetical protein
MIDTAASAFRQKQATMKQSLAARLEASGPSARIQSSIMSVGKPRRMVSLQRGGMHRFAHAQAMGKGC